MALHQQCSTRSKQQLAAAPLINNTKNCRKHLTGSSQLSCSSRHPLLDVATLAGMLVAARKLCQDWQIVGSNTTCRVRLLFGQAAANIHS
jgi:hypothetical protein